MSRYLVSVFVTWSDKIRLITYFGTSRIAKFLIFSVLELTKLHVSTFHTFYTYSIPSNCTSSEHLPFFARCSLYQAKSYMGGWQGPEVGKTVKSERGKCQVTGHSDL